MARRAKFFIGFSILIGAIYGALPQLIAEFLRHRLTSYGFSRVSVSAGYPGLSELRLGVLEMGRQVGSRSYLIRATDVVVRYRPEALLAGRFASIRIPQAMVERTIEHSVSVTEPTGMPLGFLSGQWLSRLPVNEAALDELSMQWSEASGEVYDLRAAGRIKNRQMDFKGVVSATKKAERSLEFSLHATDAGEMELSVHAPAAQRQPIFQLTNRVGGTGDGALSVDGSLLARLDASAPLLGLADVLSGLKGNLQSRWQGSLPALAGTPEAMLANMQLTSEHRLEFEAERLGELVDAIQIHLEANAELKQGAIDWQFGDKSRATGRLSLMPSGVKNQGEQPIAIALPRGLSGRLDLGGETPSLQLNRGARMQIGSLRWGDFLLPMSHIELADTFRLDYRPETARWSGGAVSLRLDVSPLRWGDSVVENGGIMLKLVELGGTDKNWHGEGEIQIKGISPAIGKQPLPSGQLSARFRLDPRQFSVQGALANANKKLVLQAQGMHEFTTGSGRGQFDLQPVVFGDPDSKLSQLLEPWPYPIDFTSGRLAASGQVVWHRPVRPGASNALRVEDEFTLKLDDVSGQYKKFGFSGLSAQLALADHKAVRTKETAQFRMASLDIGIPITGLIATGEVAPHPQTGGAIIRIGNFSADLLGGKAFSKPFEWDISADRHRLAVELERLALSEILALEGQQGLEGDGRLNGRLPIEITAEGVVLRAGELHALPPGGRIRYRPTEGIRAMAGGNPGLALVLQALSNFRYEALKVSADSTPAGDLNMRVELRGNNPEWQSGRPLHLNLNLQENIPMLLRSLQFADELGDRLGKRAQEHFQKNH